MSWIMTCFKEKFLHGWEMYLLYTKKFFLHLRKYNSCPHCKCLYIGDEIVDEDLMQALVNGLRWGENLLEIGPHDHESEVNVNSD